MNKKYIRRIDWAAWNGAMAALVICGLVFGIGMAANAFKFLALFDGVIQIAAVFSKDAVAARRKRGPSVPPRLIVLVDLSVAALLAAYGWFGYATLVAVAGLCSASPYFSEPHDSIETQEKKTADQQGDNAPL